MKTTTFTVITIVISLVTGIQLCKAQCHINDWTALKALYESTDGNNWNNADNWEEITGNEPTSNCNLALLFGVNLNENGRVDTLNLFSNLLKGNIPPEIGKLNNLAKLSLFWNPLTGGIPPELGQLNNLKELELNGTQLNSIPPELGNLSNLVYLRLQDCQFSGDIPPELGKLSNLKELDLWNNFSLNGSIPPELGNLKSLTNLRMNWCLLSGSLPPELGNLNNLVELDLEGNRLSGSIPPELENMSNLESLILYDNQLSGNIPPELGTINNLTNLGLSGNQLSGNIPPELGKLSNLATLSLSANQLNGSIPPELANLGNLKSLGLSYNQLSGLIPKELENLSNLKSFGFDYNYFSCQDILNVINLKPQLEFFHSFNLPQYYTPLNYEEIQNYIFDTISVYKNITLTIDFPWEESQDLTYQWELNGDAIEGATQATYIIDTVEIQNTGEYSLKVYNDNCLTDESVFELISDPISVVIKNSKCHIDDWTALKALYESTNINEFNFYNWEDLAGNEPKDNCILQELYGVTLNENGRVDKLILPNSGINGSLPSELGKLKKLTFLSLPFNKISGNIPPELGNLSNLEILYLYNNELSGNLPVELGNLSSLENLSLSNNQISGSIPAQLGKLNNLTSLSMPNNQLSGSIPAEIGNLSSLTYCDLKGNLLSDSIPPTIGSLSSLTHLDLHDNQLSGSIPSELGDIKTLNFLRLDNNQLSGSIPVEFGGLNNLGYLDLSNNKFSGSIPAEFTNLSNLFNVRLAHNYFSCQNILNVFQLNQQINFTYLPQYYTPINYDDIKIQVIDSLNFDQNLSLEIDFPFDTTGVKYEWYHNDDSIPIATQPNLKFYDLQPGNAGKYILRVYNEDCLPGGEIFELVSDPMYVVIKGYDLYGQPVEYNQIMVQFETPEETAFYEEDILYNPELFGAVVKSCNCNRELYLWEFPNTEAAFTALLEIDKKTRHLKRRTKPKGGFNNSIAVGETSENSISYNVVSDAFDKVYQDSVNVFILDSGLDHIEATSFLYKEAPVSDCYTIDKARGYSYIDLPGNDSTIPISTNYKDDHWHGTFGYQSITDKLNEKTKIKIVPLKIFNAKGEGNLFELTCALYHAIDNNADIVNLSAGYQGEPSNILEDAIYNAQQKGVFITASAGNDSINIDKHPQYPAYYAGKYYVFETTGNTGNVILDSIQLNNVISVASIDSTNNLSSFSNFGKQSVTLATYGENIKGIGLADSVIVASGTSMSTYFTTKALALEIANDRSRSYENIWEDFETNWLSRNDKLLNKTITGKQINLNLVEEIVSSTNQINKNVHFVMYPNPCSNSVYFKFDNFINLPQKISVFDNSGKLIKSVNLIENTNTVQLNCNNFVSGLYLVKIQNSKFSESRKLIIK